MKIQTLPLIAIVLSIGGILIINPTAYLQKATGQPNQCDQSLWNHVYKPGRLTVLDMCKTVSGTIDPQHPMTNEADGDVHLRLKLDPQFADLINENNILHQHGDLVLEPVCQHEVTQRDVIELGTCENFHQNINIPSPGEHVVVTGSYVLDTDAGHGWTEIHPVTSIKLSHTEVQPSNETLREPSS